MPKTVAIGHQDLNAVWSLLLASGYLKVVDTQFVEETGRVYYGLMLTNAV